jgi:hypothetical protein
MELVQDAALHVSLVPQSLDSADGVPAVTAGAWGLDICLGKLSLRYQAQLYRSLGAPLLWLLLHAEVLIRSSRHVPLQSQLYLGRQ